MYIETGLERCVVEVSGYILGVVVADRGCVHFVAASPISSPDDGRQFRSMRVALRTLHKDLAARLQASHARDAA